ncbi:MAG: hypothetical protein SGPRY_009541 [Prymnesium sp.]
MLPAWPSALLLFWWALVHSLRGGSCEGLRARVPTSHARAHLYSLGLSLRLWTSPHYRAQTFAQDLRNNLRNVAVPKTGIPLSWFCVSRLAATLSLALIYPLLALAAALVCWWFEGTPVGPSFAEQLLHPVRPSESARGDWIIQESLDNAQVLFAHPISLASQQSPAVLAPAVSGWRYVRAFPAGDCTIAAGERAAVYPTAGHIVQGRDEQVCPTGLRSSRHQCALRVLASR